MIGRGKRDDQPAGRWLPWAVAVINTHHDGGGWRFYVGASTTRLQAWSGEL